MARILQDQLLEWQWPLHERPHGCSPHAIVSDIIDAWRGFFSKAAAGDLHLPGVPTRKSVSALRVAPSATLSSSSSFLATDTSAPGTGTAVPALAWDPSKLRIPAVSSRSTISSFLDCNLSDGRRVRNHHERPARRARTSHDSHLLPTKPTSFFKPGDPRAPLIGSGSDFCCAKKLGRCINKAKCPNGYFRCHNGCMNLKKIEWGKNFKQEKSFAKEHVTLDGDFHIKSIDEAPTPTLRYKNRACLKKCYNTTGPCPEFCGNGVCCQQGLAGKYCDGEIGGDSEPVCVMRAVEPSEVPMKNEDQSCDAHCGNRAGPCPDFCGRGLCCKVGEAHAGCDGSMGKIGEGRVCTDGRPPPDLMPPGGDLYHQGLRAGAEIMVVNGDTEKFRNEDPHVLLSMLNKYPKGHVYVMGPPSVKANCSDAQNYCNMNGDLLDYRFNVPQGCKDHIGCDSDQICCCKKRARRYPCETDEYALPTYMSRSMCALSSFEEGQIQEKEVLGPMAWMGWSDENSVEA